MDGCGRPILITALLGKEGFGVLDFTVHIGDFLVIGSIAGAGFVSASKWMKEVTTSIQSAAHSLEAIEIRLKSEEEVIRNHDHELRLHRDWLVGAGLDRRTGLDRRDSIS